MMTVAGACMDLGLVVAGDARDASFALASALVTNTKRAGSSWRRSGRTSPGRRGRAQGSRARASATQPLRVRALRNSSGRRAGSGKRSSQGPAAAARGPARPGSLRARSASACSPRPPSGWPPTTGSRSRRRACAATPRRSRARSGEQDVAAVLGHGRADAGVEQVLDLGDDLGGLALIDASLRRSASASPAEQRPPEVK